MLRVVVCKPEGPRWFSPVDEVERGLAYVPAVPALSPEESSTADSPDHQPQFVGVADVNVAAVLLDELECCGSREFRQPEPTLMAVVERDLLPLTAADLDPRLRPTNSQIPQATVFIPVHAD